MILALDSALSSCAVAVVRDNIVLSSFFEERLRGQAERLLPLCQAACAEAGVTLADMDAFAVTRGPGTFTGVRIGLAAAKGLALALDRPLIGVTTLAVTAKQAAMAATTAPAGRLAVAHDARRGEVYFQIFDYDTDSVTAVGPARAVALADVGAALDPAVIMLVGTATALVQAALSADMSFDFSLSFPVVPLLPQGETIARLAADVLQAPAPVIGADPLYLRPPDAVAARPVVYPFQH